VELIGAAEEFASGSECLCEGINKKAGPAHMRQPGLIATRFARPIG
jgi:hypothetical protein